MSQALKAYKILNQLNVTVMKSEEINKDTDNSGFKKDTDNNTDHINVGSVGNENSQDNGASTLRELRRKHAGKMSSSTKTRKPIL